MQPSSVGECVLTSTPDGLIVDRADPEILIAAELLDEIRAGRHHADVYLDGEVLRIEGVNRRVIYRVGDKVPNQLAYCAAWPD